MALNIRKVVAQRAENNLYKKDNFYIISIEIVFFPIKNFMSRILYKRKPYAMRMVQVSPLSKNASLRAKYILVSQPNIQHEEMLFNVIRHKQFSTYKMEFSIT